MNIHGPRGLSSVTSHGSGGGYSIKDGAGGGLKTRKTSAAGSATFSHSLVNLIQVTILTFSFSFLPFFDLTISLHLITLAELCERWVTFFSG